VEFKDKRLCIPEIFYGKHTFMVLFFWIAVVLASPKNQSSSPTLILQSANSNENSYTNGEFVSVLRENVVFTYDDITISSDEATWWQKQGIISFKDNIKVRRGSSTLSCDRMNFTKNSSQLTANGNFHYIDTLEKSQLTGNDAVYHIEKKIFTLKGNPALIYFDTAAADTLKITGLRMSYIDSLKQATVTDSVVITKGKLKSRCGLAHFFTHNNTAFLRREPVINFEAHTLTGDSIDLAFGEKSLKNASVMGHSHGIYIDITSDEKDTAYTHIWGDSLYISVSDSMGFDSLWAFGKALTKYYISSSPELVSDASGKTMLLAFESNGNVKNVKIWGNARSKYHIEEQRNKGTNEASGDSITVTFKNGRARTLTLVGSARGIYFPRDL
jgi:lipopolysaccharide export system protein LptA